MSVMNTLKRLAIAPLSAKTETVKVGSADSWNIIPLHSDRPFVIAAGVGQNVSFEEQLAQRWNAEVVLMDPTPTGVDTMKRLNAIRGFTFLEIGLASKDGPQSFSEPLSEQEGSFSVARGDGSKTVEFQCKSVGSLMKEFNKTHLDILKMDVEGFEYDIIRGIDFKSGFIKQICMEIHVSKSSGSKASSMDALLLIFYLFRNGYRIVYNKAMDFTFAHVSLLRDVRPSVG